MSKQTQNPFFVGSFVFPNPGFCCTAAGNTAEEGFQHPSVEQHAEQA